RARPRGGQGGVSGQGSFITRLSVENARTSPPHSVATGSLAGRSLGGGGQGMSPRTTLIGDTRKERVHAHRAELFALAGTYVDGACFELFLAHHDHVGELLQARLADLVADTVGPEIGFTAQAGVEESFGDLTGVLAEPFAHGNHGELHRREPHRERARVILDDDTHEALEAAVAGAMQHHRRVSLTVGTHVGEAKPSRHREVELDGAALPRTFEYVADVEVDLRAVERAVTFVDDVAHARAI